jgi:hypothetical protein
MMSSALANPRTLDVEVFWDIQRKHLSYSSEPANGRPYYINEQAPAEHNGNYARSCARFQSLEKSYVRATAQSASDSFRSDFANPARLPLIIAQDSNTPGELGRVRHQWLRTSVSNSNLSSSASSS